MFLFSFFLVLSIVTYINNQVKDISEENSSAYKFDKNGIIVISILFVIGLTLNLLHKLFYKFLIPALIIYMFICVVSLTVVNALRIQAIEKERENIKQMYEILEDVLKSKGNIDYNNVPFEIQYKNKQIDKIILTIRDTTTFRDSMVTQAVYNLNKFLPHRQWVSSVDLPEKKCIFIGNKLPPSVAMYPGGDLRPWNWIPLGIGGNGEIGWNLGAKDKNMGRSMYIYEDTKMPADTVSAPKIPQCLTLGATGGGKAIFIDEIINILD